MYSANVYKIFLASPSDVSKERQIAREVIQKWNDLHSERSKVVLQAIGWETHSYSSMDDRAQSVLNKQILRDADFLIGIFWTRIGTPTGNHESGTLEEIREHINAGKPAMICFSDQPVQMGSVNQDQYNKLIEFKTECYGQGLVSGYETLESFRNIINDALVMRANSQDPFVGYEHVEGSVDILLQSDEESSYEYSALTDDAKELLVEASNDPSGHIMRLAFIGGATIQTNGKEMLRESSPREKARWEAALNVLINEGLVESVGYKNEVYVVSHYGYQVADKIKNA